MQGAGVQSLAGELKIPHSPQRSQKIKTFKNEFKSLKMSYKIKQRTQKAGVGTRKKLEEVSTKEAGSVEDDHFLPGGGHQPGGGS